MVEERSFSESNRLSIIHVLAGLISNPLLFSDNKYRFSLEDFPERFHKIIFGAVQYLASKRLPSINFIDIDEYLKPYTDQYMVYSQNHGNSYIQNILKMYDPSKFDYYYNTLKKYSLINDLNKHGIDTRDIYDPNITDINKSNEMYERFDNWTVNDILKYEEVKILEAKQEYGSNSDCVEEKAGTGLRELKEHFKERPDIGLPLLLNDFTTVARGQRRGCLFMESAPSGVGKSRRGNSEACHLAVSEHYNVVTKEWEKTRYGHQKVLIISTELELDECQRMWLAFVSGVSEDHIKDGRYLPGEEERVDKAIELIEKANLYFVSITNYDADDISGIIRKYKQLYDVDYVYFDYLGETLKTTSSFTRKTHVKELRTDQILLMMSSTLKDLAKTLGIYIWTATQLSGNYKDDDILDSAYLRSAKSLADKIDCGAIIVPVRPKDDPVIDQWMQRKQFELRPNFVMHIYKVRAGSYQNIKLYFYFDRGTCGAYDCFVTNQRGEILNLKHYDIEFDDSDDEETKNRKRIENQKNTEHNEAILDETTAHEESLGDDRNFVKESSVKKLPDDNENFVF